MKARTPQGTAARGQVRVEPLAPRHWPALEALFGASGACAGCWCMFWRLREGERFDDVKGAVAKRRFRALVLRGQAQGFLAFDGGEPVGWLSAGPRRSFPKLDRAPSLRVPDAEAVFSLPCFFVRRQARGKGVAAALLAFATDHLLRGGVEILEGYPVKPSRAGQPIPPAFAYTGTLPLFRRAGFRVVGPKPTGKQRVRRSADDR